MGAGPGLRVAVVGVGYRASKHLRALGDLPDVAEVVAVDPELAAVPGQERMLDEGRGYRTLEEALPHVDAVVVATPPTSHAVLGLHALTAGKHVLVETPLATTTEDALALVAAADAAGTVLMTGHTAEHDPAVSVLRDRVQHEDFGTVHYLDSERLNLGLYRSDVNVVLDLAPHDVSIATFVLGPQPTSVSAWAARHVHEVHEDLAQLRLHYGDLGPVATIRVSWVHPHRVRRTVVVGSRQMAVYDDASPDQPVRLHGPSVVPPVVPPVADTADPLVLQDRQFVRCALTGARPATDGRRGAAVVRVLEAAQLSLREAGRAVALDEVEPATHDTRPFVPVPAADGLTTPVVP